MNLAPGAFASLLAAINQHGGKDLPRNLGKYLQDKKPDTHLRTGGAENETAANGLDIFGNCQRESFDREFFLVAPPAPTFISFFFSPDVSPSF